MTAGLMAFGARRRPCAEFGGSFVLLGLGEVLFLVLAGRDASTEGAINALQDELETY